jgi:hypothetical protein
VRMFFAEPLLHQLKCLPMHLFCLLVLSQPIDVQAKAIPCDLTTT